ncbi:MAG: 4Fe-4S binding protein, partial [Lentimicrobium sp.]|nr:4Fe-4S binding protein [Lentimicrobium sp.]
MVPYKDALTIPEVDDKICIGCGACEYACPTKPYRAIFVEGNSVHKLANEPVQDKIILKETEEDFPF